MTNGYFANPLIFIIDTLFYLYMLVIALRLLLPWIKWSSQHQLPQMIIRATQPAVGPLKQLLPMVGKLDTAVLILLLLVALFKLLLISVISGGIVNVFAFLPLVIAEVFSLFITLFTFSIIIEVILSWLSPPGSYNPVQEMIVQLNAPLLNPVRRRMPDMGGIDLSPLVVIIGLQVLAMLVIPLLTAPAIIA